MTAHHAERDEKGESREDSEEGDSSVLSQDSHGCRLRSHGTALPRGVLEVVTATRFWYRSRDTHYLDNLASDQTCWLRFCRSGFTVACGVSRCRSTEHQHHVYFLTFFGFLVANGGTGDPVVS